MCEFKRGLFLERIFSEDFGPMIEWRSWRLSDGPELSERVVDQGN